MIKLEFAASRFGNACTASAEPGDALVDHCDAADAPVPFSCRDANCGTCLIRVDRAELLQAASDDEQLVLDTLRAPEDHRLACQARLRIDAQGTLAIALGDLG